jgi:TonB family protein
VTRKTSDEPKPAKRTATAQNRGGVTGQGTGQGAGTAQGSGNSQTGSSRWTGLYAPKPSYPSASKKAGHEGRVGITFEVDERGYIVNAKVSSPCAYPELNEQALAKVRSSWRAKPGPRAQATKTIVFQIN